MKPPFQEPVEVVVQSLGTDARYGLTGAEAKSRLEREGPNEIKGELAVPGWKKFLAQFKDLLVILLLVATAISAGLWALERESPLPYEAIAIFTIVLLNAIMGFIQESRAESAVAALGKMAAAQASVLRDGKRGRIPATEVVPGDIILLEEGDRIPADGRLLHTTAFQAAEAALTGESVPTFKDTAAISEDAALGDRDNMVFSGTVVTSGHGIAVVTATGGKTEMGRIAGLLKSTPQETTPLQKELDRIGKRLGAVVIAIAGIMIFTIVLVEKVRGLAAFFDVLILGVALAVAAVPEGLPAIVTASLALGVRRMARRNAIVRHLTAVETLGSASVIASDKTGTLTKNEMTVRTVATASGRVNFAGAGYSPEGEIKVEGGATLNESLRIELERSLTAAHRASNAVLQQHQGRWSIQGDPTEGALIVAARKAGLAEDKLADRFVRVGEVPFSSERKLMSTVNTDSERKERLLVFTKGAPDILLGRCVSEYVGEEKRPLTPNRRAEIQRTNEELAGEALRTLGVAVREVPATDVIDGETNESIERELVFLGLIGMIDPPRNEAKEAVKRALNAGVRPIMITGDHPKTAAIIAWELGITSEDRAVTGQELARQSDQQLAETVRRVSVYARVDPEHKLRIVKALQSNGAVVAMTGDGVNDAPALKTADIGIAMGITGTDVSKQAADLILTDDNFATIVAAVEEGRAIFDNIRKFLRYLLSSNMGEVMTMFFGVIFSKVIGVEQHGETVVLPLLATQILWTNLVTDGAPALALGIDPPRRNVMRMPPRTHNEGVITRRMWISIFLVGAIMAIGVLLVFDAAMPGGLIQGAGDLRYGQTMAFTTLILFQMFNVFNARSDEESAFRGLFSNAWLWAAVGLSIFLQFAVIYVPFLQRAFSTVALSSKDWLSCFLVASSVLWLQEANKIFRRKKALRQTLIET
jgi:Ca2+-transporting ATPase